MGNEGIETSGIEVTVLIQVDDETDWIRIKE